MSDGSAFTFTYLFTLFYVSGTVSNWPKDTILLHLKQPPNSEGQRNLMPRKETETGFKGKFPELEG